MVGRQNHTRQLEGKGLAPGVGCGVAYRVETTQPSFYRLRISEAEIDSERSRFEEAVRRARQQYLRDKQKLEQVLGTDHSYIIEAHLLMLDDQDLIGQVERRITERLDTAENAVCHVGEKLLSAYESLEDEFFKDRGFDFQEVIDRILANLLKLVSERESQPSEDVILVGSEIGLSTLARFPLGRVQGLVSGRSGVNSHLAIIARSLQIPLVTGVDDLRDRIRTGDYLCVDGTRGVVEIGSSREFLQETRLRVIERIEPSVQSVDPEPCQTLDGERVRLLANTEFGDEVDPALRFGAEGIGLFRTEFLFMSGAQEGDDEEKQFKWYQKLALTISPLTADVRTLDVARRYDSRFTAGDEAGVLGLRGIRYSLSDRGRFQEQVRAVVRARKQGDLRIVLPMVSSVDELIQARALIDEAERHVGAANGGPIPVGVLIETPAAVWTLEAIAPLCDFLAVGTNDLIQYTLAAGRLNDEVADLYNPMHPAVLKSLQRIHQVATELGRDVAVCGEMAANPLYAGVLVGLGYRKLSMTSFAIPRVKAVLRGTSAAVLSELCRELLVQRTLAEVATFVENRLLPEVGEGFAELRSQ